jgi:hypothetical protein
MNTISSTQSHSFGRGLGWGAGLAATVAAALYLLVGGGPLHVAVSTTSVKTAQNAQEVAPVSDAPASSTVHSTSGYDTPVTSSDARPAASESHDTYSAGDLKCGAGLSVGPNTSCPFAERVRDAYEQFGAGTIRVPSPVTHKAYEMTCVGESPVVCRGGNNASVYF